MNIKGIGLGISDFKDIITRDYYYIDKSLLIKEIIDRGDKVILLPRPRRFGKTLNLSMLNYFFDCGLQTGVSNPSPNLSLFENLAIMRAGKEYIEKMGQFPVIFLTFKDLKDSKWESCLENLKQLIQEVYLKHDYLLDSPLIKSTDKIYIKKIINLEGSTVDYYKSLGKLLKYLNQFYNKRVVILIDEYDTPIHCGYSRNYYDEIVGFIRNFLSGALKDTDQYLEKSVLSGILRIGKESIFSGLNNLGVYTVLSEEFGDKFGFTEKETECILKDFNLLDKYNEVQSWYNGYIFGKDIIYNPWSIINLLASKGNYFKPYWINTANNEIIESLLSKGGKELKNELEQLIRGESIEKVIDEDIVMKDIERRDELLWSFLLMSGYLKQTGRRQAEEMELKTYYSLAIPNLEVRKSYTSVIENYFLDKIENTKLETMLKALIEGDIIVFEKILRKLVLSIFSYHDFGNESEKVYQALVLGFLVWISTTHEIKSNRESGYGRYDISIIPRDKNKIGYIIEFKALDTDSNETVDSAVESALNQIEQKKYAAELIEKGINRIKKLAIVFNGKDVYVREN